jgi:hypothetical protein
MVSGAVTGLRIEAASRTFTTLRRVEFEDGRVESACDVTPELPPTLPRALTSALFRAVVPVEKPRPLSTERTWSAAAAAWAPRLSCTLSEERVAPEAELEALEEEVDELAAARLMLRPQKVSLRRVF